MRPIRIRGGEVLSEAGLTAADLALADGVVVAEAVENAVEIDARGLVVAPGLVDIHGDAFERQVMPRPGVFFPIDVALADTDRQLAANGITTAYHALTLSWEPGLRSVGQAERMLDAIGEMEPGLTVEHRVQLRWETFCFEARDLIRKALKSQKKPSLAFNDHTSMDLRPDGQEVTERPFDPTFGQETIALDHPTLQRRVAKQAGRSGLGTEGFLDLLGQIWERRGEVSDRVQALGKEAAHAGAPMLSHDDSQLETRAFFREAGAGIAEFPMTEPVARDARAQGEHVVLGAPNVVRGGSHIGSLSAADMLEAGVCTVLASDYYYPAMLAAAARLRAERRAPLWQIWAALSANPAEALGLTDRGTLSPGKRADVVLLDWPESRAPTLKATISGGQIAYLSGDILA